MKMNLLPSGLALACILTGCSPFKPPPLSRSNPANPNAAEAPLPPAAPLLMTGNNYAMPPEVEGQPMQMDMNMEMPDHEGHGKPSEKAPAHDHSGHEQKQTAPAHEHPQHQHESPKQ
jgi:hypothetical protein